MYPKPYCYFAMRYSAHQKKKKKSNKNTQLGLDLFHMHHSICAGISIIPLSFPSLSYCHKAERVCVYLCEERDSPTPISSNSFCPHCNTTNFLFSLGFLEIDNFVLSVLGGSIMSAQIKFCS